MLTKHTALVRSAPTVGTSSFPFWGNLLSAGETDPMGPVDSMCVLVHHSSLEWIREPELENPLAGVTGGRNVFHISGVEEEYIDDIVFRGNLAMMEEMREGTPYLLSSSPSVGRF